MLNSTIYRTSFNPQNLRNIIKKLYRCTREYNHIYKYKQHPSLIISAGLRILGLYIYILIWISVMNTLYVRCQTKDYILDIGAARAGMRINKVNSIIKKVAKISITQIIIELVCQNNRILLFF